MYKPTSTVPSYTFGKLFWSTITILKIKSQLYLRKCSEHDQQKAFVLELEVSDRVGKNIFVIELLKG